MFDNPAFYKSLANQRYMQLTKSYHLSNQIAKETKQATSARVKQVFTMVYRVTQSQVFKTMAQHKTLGFMTFN